MRVLGHLWARLRALPRDVRGSIVLKFALIAPAVAMLSAGAIDLHAVHAARLKLQDIADAGALAGAPSLGLAADGSAAKARAESFVAGSMTEWATAPHYTGLYEVLRGDGRQRAIRVSLKANRQSFFANLLPPGGWNFAASATATSMGMTPLCVLITADKGNKELNVKDSGRLSAPACMVHSNGDILVEGGSIAAGMVQASKSAGGVISPSPGSGAAAIADPFANLPLTDQKTCTTNTKIDVKTGFVKLSPGVHCADVIMAGDSQLVLQPGEHWFMGGQLVIKERARLTGADVALFFNKSSKFDFTDSAMVNLDGRKSGLYAGMVMLATRTNTQDFIITSDQVETLLGVIYVPNARLIVEGKADVARDSAWTVIVARELQLKGQPSVFVNADYDASDVPVPAGVGPRTGGSVLIE